MVRKVSGRADEYAWEQGRKFGATHDLAHVTTSMMDLYAQGLGIYRYFDVFKYGAQHAWRRRGQLPMRAYDLEPGDVFRVKDHVDPECDRRVCLTNDRKSGIRFGFPNNRKYWCSMGGEVEVQLVGVENDPSSQK